MTLPLEKWIHVTAVSRQGGESCVYLDGVKSRNTTIGENAKGLDELWIGCSHDAPTSWVDSWISEVKVFYEALSDSQVQHESSLFHQKVGSS